MGQSSGIKQKTLFMLIIALILINALIILAYRKYLQKEMETDMKIQVSSAVSQYIALNQIPELQPIGGEIAEDSE